MPFKTERNYIFIAANPLQILMSASIIRQLELVKNSVLIIHGGFTGAKEIVENFSIKNIVLDGLKIIYLNQRKDAFSLINKSKPSGIFIDGDVGFKNFITLLYLKCFNKKLKINVFEEGVGTYRNDLYRGTKKLIFRTIGIGSNFGGCKLTSCIYTTNPKRYKTIFPNNLAEVHLIKDGPATTILRDYDAWALIFNYKEIEKINSNECNLYLTNWNFKSDSITDILKLQGDFYIKPHPRCNVAISIPEVVVLNTAAPAEMLIFDLAKKYNVVRVYHHGSSVEQYFSDFNVMFKKI
jgi:hypothetical protein